jgi:hypothetical protein
MTTRYNEFLNAYSNGTLSIDNINWTVKLCYETYQPLENHTYLGNEVKPFEISSGGSLNGSEFKDNPMTDIMNLMKTRIKENIATEPSDAINKINEMAGITDERKSELNMLFSSASIEEDYKWWERAWELGLRYMVVESPNKKLLFFCEEIDRYGY